MGDAFTDMARNQHIASCFYDYLQAVKIFLEKPTAKNKRLVIATAERHDKVSANSGEMELAPGAKDYLERLKKGDKVTWSQLLFLVKDRGEFHEFKNLSPYADMMIVLVDYSHGSVKVHHGFQNLLDKLIAKDHGWKIYDGDKYIVAMPDLAIINPEVICANCDGPRSVEEKPTQPDPTPEDDDGDIDEEEDQDRY